MYAIMPPHPTFRGGWLCTSCAQGIVPDPFPQTMGWLCKIAYFLQSVPNCNKGHSFDTREHQLNGNPNADLAYLVHTITWLHQCHLIYDGITFHMYLSLHASGLLAAPVCCAIKVKSLPVFQRKHCDSQFCLPMICLHLILPKSS